jgi:hypothetical protein
MQLGIFTTPYSPAYSRGESRDPETYRRCLELLGSEVAPLVAAIGKQG